MVDEWVMMVKEEGGRLFSVSCELESLSLESISIAWGLGWMGLVGGEVEGI